MTEPVVSVNMITYNHALFIIQAIEGVLRQNTIIPFELVIGEDCSTDGTREIVHKYQKKYPDIIRVITSNKNVGARINSLRTIKHCRGKYIAFCEGDDYWHNPAKLQKQLDHMNTHPRCGMVFADCDVYHQSSNKLKKSVRYSDGYHSFVKLSIEQIIGDWKLTRWPWTCTVMARRDLIEEVMGKDPFLHQSGKFLMGDTQLFAEISLISEIIYIPESLATYRMLDVSASNDIDPRKRLLFWISASEMRMYLCDKHKLSESVRKKAESVWCEKSLYLAFLDRNTELALEVKKKKQQEFNWKEWLRFLGAKYTVIHYGYRAALLFYNPFRKQLDPLA